MTFENAKQELKDWEFIIREYEEEFLEKIIKNEHAKEILNISFNARFCIVQYHIQDGHMINEFILIDKVLEFLQTETE